MARRKKADEELGLPELPPEAGIDEEPPRPREVELGGGMGGGVLGMPGGGMVGGGFHEMREVSIPIWEESHRYSNGAYRLSVSRITPEGITASLGFLPSSANEDQVIARGQGQSGTYLIMPVDEHGEPMRRQPYRRVVDADHPAVRRYKASSAAGAAHSGVAMVQGLGGGGLNPEVLNFFQSVLQAKDAEKDEMMAYLREKDESIAKVREETSRMQLAVATDHTKNALEVQQSILEADRARQDFVQQQQLEMLRRQQEAERQAREAEAERAQNFYAAMLKQQEASAAAERERREDEQRRREAELERERRRLAEDQKRREAWAREQEAARQERAERERTRDREHMELVIKMLEKQNEVADPFKNVAQLLEKSGQLKELVPALFGGGDSAPQGIMGMLTTLATEGMKTFAEMQKAQVHAEFGAPELETVPMTPEMAAQLQMQGGALPMIAEAPPELEPSVAAQIAQEEEMRRRMAAFAAPDAPAPAPAPAAPAPGVTGRHPATLGATAATVERSFDPPAGVVLPDGVKKLEPVVRKKAREGIRDLVAAIKSVPEAQWQATITTGIMKTPQIIPYITAATIRAALLEGGADPALAQKIITAVDATGIVPDSIPRG